MAQKLNLDFSIAESILKGVVSTPDVRIGSVNINETDVSLVGDASSALDTSNTTLDHANSNVKSVSKNYENAISSFKALQVGNGIGVIGIGVKK